MHCHIYFFQWGFSPEASDCIIFKRKEIWSVDVAWHWPQPCEAPDIIAAATILSRFTHSWWNCFRRYSHRAKHLSWRHGASMDIRRAYQVTHIYEFRLMFTGFTCARAIYFDYNLNIYTKYIPLHTWIGLILPLFIWSTTHYMLPPLMFLLCFHK